MMVHYGKSNVASGTQKKILNESKREIEKQEKEKKLWWYDIKKNRRKDWKIKYYI